MRFDHVFPFPQPPWRWHTIASSIAPWAIHITFQNFLFPMASLVVRITRVLPIAASWAVRITRGGGGEKAVGLLSAASPRVQEEAARLTSTLVARRAFGFRGLWSVPLPRWWRNVGFGAVSCFGGCDLGHVYQVGSGPF